MPEIVDYNDSTVFKKEITENLSKNEQNWYQTLESNYNAVCSPSILTPKFNSNVFIIENSVVWLV